MRAVREDQKASNLYQQENQPNSKFMNEVSDDLNAQFQELPYQVKIALMHFVEEMKRSEEKHPNWPDIETPHGALHAASIVAEESGELTRAALQYGYERGSSSDMLNEAIQTGAMALRLLKNAPLYLYL